MQTIRRCASRLRGIPGVAIGVLLLLAFGLVLAGPSIGADREPGADREAGADREPITAGSGEKYRTIVERSAEGPEELSREDYRQATLLTSQLVAHLNTAVRHLADERLDEARAETGNAEKLLRIVKEMLPVTTETVIVEDAQGSEVYRYERRIQDDLVPVYSEMIEVEILEPIVDAKKEQAALRGVRLADADLIHSMVLVDLDYVARKLDRASELIGEQPEEALLQLALAQARGVRFHMNKEEHPLVNARVALRLAERMAEHERIEAASENLELARTKLELYRTLVPKAQAPPAQKIERGIEKALASLSDQKTDDAVEKIRSLWQELVGLFDTVPGQAQAGDGASQPMTTAARK